jgi:hypothetical protein
MKKVSILIIVGMSLLIVFYQKNKSPQGDPLFNQNKSQDLFLKQNNTKFDVTKNSDSTKKNSARVPQLNQAPKITPLILSGVKPVISKELQEDQERIAVEGYGTYPEVDLNNTNPHKRHLVDAFKDPKTNAGSISIVGKREPFDLARYQSDPTYYLNSVEPGRAFDTAQPSADTQPIKHNYKKYYETVQNTPVYLEAKASPDMPVSFTAFDGGQFQNGLSFITIKANSNGVAKAEFTATSGVINQARVKAASPVNSGTLQWIVNVSLQAKNDQNL